MKKAVPQLISHEAYKLMLEAGWTGKRPTGATLLKLIQAKLKPGEELTAPFLSPTPEQVLCWAWEETKDR